MNTNRTNNQTFTDACVASCNKLIARLERAKDNIVAEFRDTLHTPEQLLNAAINEASAIAWQTEYPELLFPLLATEKARAAAQWNAKQESLRQRKFVPVLSI